MPFLVSRTGQLAVMRNGRGSWYQRATERRLHWAVVYCAVAGAFWITIGSLQLAVHGGGLGWVLRPLDVHSAYRASLPHVARQMGQRERG
jgi:hypothetical protein